MQLDSQKFEENWSPGSFDSALQIFTGNNSIVVIHYTATHLVLGILISPWFTILPSILLSAEHW